MWKNKKLKPLFPGLQLSLPPKRWFGNNFDPMFLEDRLLGLQAFVKNIMGHRDISKRLVLKFYTVSLLKRYSNKILVPIV